MYASAGVGAVTDNRMIISELLIFLVAKRNEKKHTISCKSNTYQSQLPTFLASRSSRWTFRQVFQPILSVKVQPLDLPATFPASFLRQGPVDGPSGKFSGRFFPPRSSRWTFRQVFQPILSVKVQPMDLQASFRADWCQVGVVFVPGLEKNCARSAFFSRPGTVKRIKCRKALQVTIVFADLAHAGGFGRLRRPHPFPCHGGSFTSIAQTPTVRSTFGICHKQRTQANRCDLALRATSRPPAGGH